jgi:hypothetical protein
MSRVARVRGVAILFVVVVIAGCGGSSKPAGPDPSKATGTTVAEKTARFTLLINAKVGGNAIQTTETGQVSFGDRLAHVYKLVPGNGIPQELVVVGPWTYTNANVDRALNDSTIRPWTKLDTRKLTAKQRNQHPDELAHVRVLVHLPDGVERAARIESIDVAGQKVTQYNGEVDPARVVSSAKPAARDELRKALANDYPSKPFPASYWLDDSGRVRRVLVQYKTAGGTPIAIDGRFSAFGGAVDIRLPPADSIQDITP